VSKAFPRDVVDWLRRNQISIFYAVPTLYQAMMRAGGIAETSLPDLRVIAFAGEPFPVGILQLYVEAFPHTDFYNLYGPTETNVCTFEKLSSTWSATDGLSIGRAIKELRVELVDDRHIVTREGEIAVLGPTVFLGYLEDGTLRDATSTIIFPFGYARRAYLTGDLGYYGDDGRIWLRGRRDHQVKRRGHRIELLDIESVAQEQPGVEACAAVWRPGSSNEGEIWLYIVHNGQTTDAITQSVRAALPRRMAPDQVHFVAELPLTTRGKLDRDALAARTPIQERDHG
jgi:acyl-coenzyme A synthetase/AMP-(fatty) acid ligase